MTRIVGLQARSIAIPLARPASFAHREVKARHYTVVRARDSDGVEGVGFCYSGNFGGQIVTAAVRELFAPLVEDDASWRITGIWDDVYRQTLLHGRAGSVMRALSAVDIALWDLNARRARLPLWQYLGASDAESVPAYASGGYYSPGKTHEDLAEEMAGYIALGFDAVKMKIGAADKSVDRARVAAVRDAIGYDVKLMLDANNAWATTLEAGEHIKALEQFAPFWIEEPFMPDEIKNHARLARMTSIPVVTGEIEQGRWRHRALLEAGATAVLQADAAVCGGITEYRRIAATAACYGISMAPHWFADLHVHLAASTPNTLFVEFFPNDDVFNFVKLLNAELEVIAPGRLRLPTTPGLGFALEPAKLQTYAIDEWS